MYYPYHPRYYYPGYWPIRLYEDVNPDFLQQSAHQSKKLMQDASKVLDKLSESKDFDAELMHAAQVSDQDKVERLIHSIGITSEVDINYNPDGLRLEFKTKVAEIDCCKLHVALRWR
ncbi:hypothetical protein [Halobacillus seohaensis]|uniref:Inner spore coat protein n=1 Tax=Halobacillus seohaensis TaxID=447421 RepID=A0ABW2ER17_9BACI